MWNARAERASITIDAPIGVVWSVFTDVERWPAWASSFTSVELVDRPMRSLTRRYLAIEATGLKQRTEKRHASGRSGSGCRHPVNARKIPSERGIFDA
jgi:uncharacterized membrane protein